MDPFPLSLLNDYLNCPRRAALKAIEGYREENEHTILGDIAHEHADLPGYEVAKGVLLWRALPIWSERLGLSGKCDIVEVEMGSAGDSPNESSSSARPHPQPISHRMGEGGRRPGEGACIRALRPVEYKRGKRRQFDNDDAQLCAQALCLEEMFGITVERGAVFHATSKRRRDVEFTAELRQLTENAIGELHRLVEQEQVPPAEFKPACEECSLFEICLPKVTSLPASVERAARRLYEV